MLRKVQVSLGRLRPNLCGRSLGYKKLCFKLRRQNSICFTFKLRSDLMLRPLNFAITSRCYPLIWKTAVIKPLFKKDKLDSIQFKNYRPISLLPVSAKILEKHLNAQLSIYLEQQQLLDPTQYGFRSYHGSETALITAANNIRTLADVGQTMRLILLDLSSAFDTISSNKLIDRRQEFGVTDSALKLLASFLTNRSQKVKMDQFNLDPILNCCGVHRGPL